MRIIDLRPRADFEECHLPGASRLSRDELSLRFLYPPHNRSLLLVGSPLPDLVSAAALFDSLGYTVRILDAPTSAWPAPLETGSEQRPAWEPSPLAAAWGNRLPRCGDPILDLAAGSCRDAVFLAMEGYRVTAIDRLPDALEQGRILAARHGVEVDFRCADVERDPASWGGAWGAVHVRRYLHRPGFPLLKERLSPGGVLLYETFLRRQADEGRRPRNPDYLLSPGELLNLAESLTVLSYDEGRDGHGDWVARLVARKGSPSTGRSSLG
jgi:hypothetical protein